MIRAPIPEEVALAWWREAVETPEYERRRTPIADDPQCGFFKRKLVRGGVYVPARIWLDQDIDEAGELLGVELRAEVNGDPVDPLDAWSYLAGNPITEAEFNYLKARGDWSAFYAPHEAAARPRQPIDWQTKPAPVFT